jgi:hypothetical protein
MAELLPVGTRNQPGVGQANYTVHRVRHDGGSNTIEVDQSANQVYGFAVDGQAAPTTTLTDSTGDTTTFLKTVTISGGGSGLVDVTVWHPGPVASVKP